MQAKQVCAKCKSTTSDITCFTHELNLCAKCFILGHSNCPCLVQTHHKHQIIAETESQLKRAAEELQQNEEQFKLLVDKLVKELLNSVTILKETNQKITEKLAQKRIDRIKSLDESAYQQSLCAALKWETKLKSKSIFFDNINNWMKYQLKLFGGYNQHALEEQMQISNDQDLELMTKDAYMEVIKKALDQDEENDIQQQMANSQVKMPLQQIQPLKNVFQVVHTRHVPYAGQIVLQNEKVKEIMSQLPKYEPEVRADFNSLQAWNPQQFEDGSVYAGQWKGDLRWGTGIQYNSDGSVYHGSWTEDQPNGKGRMINASGSWYEGDFVNGKAHGEGCLHASDGMVYTGQWVLDQQCGFCQITWADGNKYVGNCKDGKRNGYGTFESSEGFVYEGEFKDNEMEGPGQCKWPDQRTYKGCWKNSKMEGQGEFTWPDGKKYKGNYKCDLKEGYGEFTWPNGRMYKGQWKNGKQHGNGVYCDQGKKERKGLWEEGTRIKWLDQ